MKKTLTAVLILLPFWALASTAQTPAVNSRVAPLQENTSSSLSTQQQARQWGLSDSDWSRYQTLMKGERGIMSPGLDPLTALGVETDRVFAETGEPEKIYLPVGIYRERISWLYDQSLRHFHSCVGNAERLSWRSQALNVLDRVIRLDSRRAKSSDRQMLASAVQDVRKRISQISSDGSLRFYS